MFELYTAAQYRGLGIDGLEARRAAILAECENPESETSVADLEEQVRMCESEYELRSAAANLRARQAQSVNDGEAKAIARMGGAPAADEDPFDTPEYRKAFMEYVCRGTKMPEHLMDLNREAMLRSGDANTTTGDIPAMIPTTLMTQIIEKLENYGEIYAGVTKTNVQGGVEYPVLELGVEAHWVGEEEVSDYQELLANEKVTFSYHELECRLSQSWLASVVSFAQFQQRFVSEAVKAMTKKMDATIISGSGSGQFKGILNDTRIENTVSMSATDVADWKKWISIVDAAILEEYQDGVFIMAKATWDKCIRTLADDNNAPVYEGYNPVNGTMERRLMGKPVLFTKQLPGFDAADDEDVFVIYGRLEDYAINSNQTMMTYQWSDPETRKKKTLAYMVADGKVLDPYGWLLVAKEGL